MSLRPRTKFVKKVKSRKCAKCGSLLGSQRVRCKRCSQPAGRPKK
jgi:hypothetical protein